MERMSRVGLEIRYDKAVIGLGPHDARFSTLN